MISNSWQPVAGLCRASKTFGGSRGSKAGQPGHGGEWRGRNSGCSPLAWRGVVLAAGPGRRPWPQALAAVPQPRTGEDRKPGSCPWSGRAGRGAGMARGEAEGACISELTILSALISRRSSQGPPAPGRGQARARRPVRGASDAPVWAEPPTTEWRGRPSPSRGGRSGSAAPLDRGRNTEPPRLIPSPGLEALHLLKERVEGITALVVESAILLLRGAWTRRVTHAAECGLRRPARGLRWRAQGPWGAQEDGRMGGPEDGDRRARGRSHAAGDRRASAPVGRGMARQPRVRDHGLRVPRALSRCLPAVTSVGPARSAPSLPMTLHTDQGGAGREREAGTRERAPPRNARCRPGSRKSRSRSRSRSRSQRHSLSQNLILRRQVPFGAKSWSAQIRNEGWSRGCDLLSRP